MKVQAAWNRKYRHNNPLKAKAHYIVNNAMRRGELSRKPCEVCGKEKSEAHHEDYTKPLDVMWLCQKHHADKHYGADRKPKGYIRKGRPNRYKDNENADKMRELKAAGLSYLQIGQQIGMSKSQVYKIVNQTTYC